MKPRQTSLNRMRIGTEQSARAFLLTQLKVITRRVWKTIVRPFATVGEMESDRLVAMKAKANVAMATMKVPVEAITSARTCLMTTSMSGCFNSALVNGLLLVKTETGSD
jgi:hypothetical protein